MRSCQAGERGISTRAREHDYSAEGLVTPVHRQTKVSHHILHLSDRKRIGLNRCGRGGSSCEDFLQCPDWHLCDRMAKSLY